MHNKKYARVTMLVILAAGLIFSGCGLGAVEGTPTMDAPTGQEPASSIVSATGVVVPMKWASLSMGAAGLVERVFVSEGDQVGEGQPLVRLAGGDPQNPSPQLQAALRAAELEVQAAQQALDSLNETAEAARVQAEQAINDLAGQVHDLEYQLEKLDIPDEQVDLEPLEAFDQARDAYQQALEAFKPYEDRDEENSVRKDRLQKLNNAKADYNDAVQRLSLSMALSAVEANLEKARQDRDAYAQGPLLEDLLLARQRLDSARAALEAAKAAPGELTLRAPFSGTVSEVMVEVGEWAVPGVPVLVLADLSRLQVETTDLNEIDMARIQIGDEVSLSFDALAEVVVKGKVVFIAYKASSGAGVNYKVVIEMEQIPERLRWGMSAFVDITP